MDVEETGRQRLGAQKGSSENKAGGGGAGQGQREEVQVEDAQEAVDRLRPYRLGRGDKARERPKGWSAALQMGASEKKQV